jgi:predicted metal-dependent hydrolase
MVNRSVRTTRLQGVPLHYDLRWSERARRIRLSVSAEGVQVVVPKGITASEAERFIQQNSDWLTKQLQKIERSRARLKKQRLPKDVILLRGKPMQLKWVNDSAPGRTLHVNEIGGKLEVHLPAKEGVDFGKIVEGVLREMARKDLTAVVIHQAKAMQVSPKGITVRDQRTRWGSCSNRGTLSFNWRLIMAPPEILNYVVVHELAHLKVPNHSPEFWALVGQHYPDFKAARMWLKENAGALHPDFNLRT